MFTLLQFPHTSFLGWLYREPQGNFKGVLWGFMGCFGGSKNFGIQICKAETRRFQAWSGRFDVAWGRLG